MIDEKLIHAAVELGKAANKMADEHFPERLAGIVKLHAGLAVGAGLIPVPGADMLAAGANIWAMYARINGELDMPFSENAMKSIGMGVITNLGGLVIGAAVFGSIAKLVPGIGTFGGMAVAATTIYGVTLLSGYVYMSAIAEILEKKSKDNITVDDIKKATSNQMSDKKEMKDFVKQAAKEYKKD